MKKNIFGVIKKTCVVLTAVMMMTNATDAMAADKWTVTEISDYYNEYESEDEQYMNAMKDGSVQYVTTSERYLETKNEDIYSIFSRKTIGDSKIKNTKQFKGNFADYCENYHESTHFTKAFDDCTIIINRSTRNNTALIEINRYNKKGKQTLKYTDKIRLTKKHTLPSVEDVMVEGNKIYYCYHEEDNYEKVYVRSIEKNNKKNGKAKKVCSITNKKRAGRARLENGSVYTMTSDKIAKYSLNGKKTGTFKLPEGEKKILTEVPDYDSMDPNAIMQATMIINNFCVNGNNVFYCNVNGIYKLGKNKNPKLIYNAENDIFFAGEYGVVDICAGNNNTFYLMFDSINNYKPCMYDWAIKLVKYKR